MVSEGYDGVDGPWNLSNAVQVNEPENLIWTRVVGYDSFGSCPAHIDITIRLSDGVDLNICEILELLPNSSYASQLDFQTRRALQAGLFHGH
jgi:hypothetical protein